MIRFGKITEIDSSKGLARVTFSEDDFVSGLLPCLVKKSKSIKESYPFEVNEQVVCMMDGSSLNGVILGAIYNKSTLPTITDKNEFGIDYGAGVGIDKMNIQTGLRTIKAKQFKVASDTESLYSLLNDILTQVQALTVTCVAPGSPSSPPINLAAFTAIQVRLQTFLTA